MIGRTALVVFVSLTGVLIAQNLESKTENAQRFEVRGRVVDENDDVVQGILIRVEAASSNVPMPAQRSRIFTDDRGAFSLSLGPGKYYISASPMEGMDNQPEIHTDGTSGAPYGQTYYPSTANQAAAVAVVPNAGRDASALVIRLLRQSTVPLTASPSAGQNSASVEGAVINQVTGAPLPRVHISLWNFDNGVHRYYGAMTNLDGTFSIKGMPAATYGILLTRAGFANPRSCCTSVALRSGEHRRDVQLPLLPSGAISGRVLNSDGVPVEDATVGARGNQGSQGSQTDSLGRFRISGLLPGIYRLDASPPMSTHPARPPQIGSDGTLPTHHIRTDYPGAVEVHPDGEVGRIEIRLARTPVVRVSGRVTGAPQGASVSLSVNNRFGGFSDIASADGTFAWWGLDPGEYAIRAWEGIGSLDLAIDGTRARNSALTTIAVAGENVDNLELRIRPPSEISGQVEFETGAFDPHPQERWLRVSAKDLNGG
ncbi:MAG TPA: carboxypeptidase-like regulatory domain-containing protein, partial [Bryobacteraceae bacterium]|nr:carboxypeptidase-like regulatory domain-containing protein [Bryobacteraceae bacterium]